VAASSDTVTTAHRGCTDRLRGKVIRGRRPSKGNGKVIQYPAAGDFGNKNIEAEGRFKTSLRFPISDRAITPTQAGTLPWCLVLCPCWSVSALSVFLSGLCRRTSLVVAGNDVRLRDFFDCHPWVRCCMSFDAFFDWAVGSRRRLRRPRRLVNTTSTSSVPRFRRMSTTIGARARIAIAVLFVNMCIAIVVAFEMHKNPNTSDFWNPRFSGERAAFLKERTSNLFDAVAKANPIVTERFPLLGLVFEPGCAFDTFFWLAMFTTKLNGRNSIKIPKMIDTVSLYKAVMASVCFSELGNAKLTVAWVKVDGKGLFRPFRAHDYYKPRPYDFRVSLKGGFYPKLMAEQQHALIAYLTGRQYPARVVDIVLAQCMGQEVEAHTKLVSLCKEFIAFMVRAGKGGHHQVFFLHYFENRNYPYEVLLNMGVPPTVLGEFPCEALIEFVLRFGPGEGGDESPLTSCPPQVVEFMLPQCMGREDYARNKFVTFCLREFSCFAPHLVPGVEATVGGEAAEGPTKKSRVTQKAQPMKAASAVEPAEPAAGEDAGGESSESEPSAGGVDVEEDPGDEQPNVDEEQPAVLVPKYERATQVDAYDDGTDTLHKGVIYKGVVIKAGSANEPYTVSIFAHPDEHFQYEEQYLHPLRELEPIREREEGEAVEFLVKNRKAKSSGELLDCEDAARGVWVEGTVRKVLPNQQYMIKHPDWDVRSEKRLGTTTSIVDVNDIRTARQ
jgi:hypothetical protein